MCWRLVSDARRFIDWHFAVAFLVGVNVGFHYSMKVLVKCELTYCFTAFAWNEADASTVTQQRCVLLRPTMAKWLCSSWESDGHPMLTVSIFGQIMKKRAINQLQLLRVHLVSMLDPDTIGKTRQIQVRSHHSPGAVPSQLDAVH